MPKTAYETADEQYEKASAEFTDINKNHNKVVRNIQRKEENGEELTSDDQARLDASELSLFRGEKMVREAYQKRQEAKIAENDGGEE